MTAELVEGRRLTPCGCPDCPGPTRPLTAPRDAWEAFCGLLDSGMSSEAVASATGISGPVMSRAHTARKMGAVYPFSARSGRALMAPREPDAGRVVALGSMRRLRALARHAWTTRAMAERTGLAKTTLRDIQAGRQETILATTHLTVVGLFDQCCGLWGGSRVAASTAINRGWPLPSAWWDLDLDDPGVTPVGFPHCDRVKPHPGRR